MGAGTDRGCACRAPLRSARSAPHDLAHALRTPLGVTAGPSRRRRLPSAGDPACCSPITVSPHERAGADHGRTLARSRPNLAAPARHRLRRARDRRPAVSGAGPLRLRLRRPLAGVPAAMASAHRVRSHAGRALVVAPGVVAQPPRAGDAARPALAAGPDGRLSLAFYRHGRRSTSVELWSARSAAAPWRPRGVLLRAPVPGSKLDFLGDYQGLAYAARTASPPSRCRPPRTHSAKSSVSRASQRATRPDADPLVENHSGVAGEPLGPSTSGDGPTSGGDSSHRVGDATSSARGPTAVWHGIRNGLSPAGSLQVVERELPDGESAIAGAAARSVVSPGGP
jgi:hypothetical protein